MTLKVYQLVFFFFLVDFTFSFMNLCMLQTPLYRRLWGPTRHVETLLPDANPRGFHSGYVFFPTLSDL